MTAALIFGAVPLVFGLAFLVGSILDARYERSLPPLPEQLGVGVPTERRDRNRP